jgi:hypothetical protein
MGELDRRAILLCSRAHSQSSSFPFLILCEPSSVSAAIKPVYQLKARHFEGKYSYRPVVVNGHITGHRKNKGRFTHRRPCGNDDQVGFLPAQGNAVETCKSGRYSMQSIFAVTGFFNQVKGFLQYRFNGYCLFFDVALGYFKSADSEKSIRSSTSMVSS